MDNLEQPIAKDEKTIPALIAPPDPIESCDFLVQIQADDAVALDIYDESGTEVTRECIDDEPGPIGQIIPELNTGSRYYESEVCLCGIEDGSILTFVITDIATGEETVCRRTVNHEGGCPDCGHHIYAEIEAVVEELRRAVTKRVVDELRAAVQKINEGGKTKPAPAPESKSNQKTKPANKSKTTGKPKPGKNKRGRGKTK